MLLVQLLLRSRVASTGAGTAAAAVSRWGVAAACSSATVTSTAAADSSTDELRVVLTQHNLSYRAVMSVLQHHSKYPVQVSPVADNIAALQQHFGGALVNKMLETAPTLVSRAAGTLLRNFEGLQAVLDGNDALTRAVVARSADVLTRAPDTLAQRLGEVQQILKVNRAQVLQLVSKAPALLWTNPDRLADLSEYLQQVAGLTQQQVFKAFLRFPTMSTTSQAQVAQRFQKVQAMLQASDEQMQRICRVFPSTLLRQPLHVALVISSLASHLQMPPEEVSVMVRQNPILTQWNVSELLKRITVVCQALRLPPELRAVLLAGHHKPLLTNHTAIPARVEHLKGCLDLPETELLPVLHRQLSVLWLTPQEVDIKAAYVNSLALLHLAWSTALQSMPPTQKLQLLRLGAPRFWRLAYLLHTGQQDSGPYYWCLTVSAPIFASLYPEYGGWLDRYNVLVSNSSIPLVPSFTPTGSAQPATYTAIVPDSLNARLSTFNQDRLRALQQHGAAAGNHTDPATPAGTHSSLSPSTNSTDTALTGPCSVPAGSPLSPAAALAAWWGVQEATIEAMLAQLQEPKQRLTRQQWQERLGALQQLMQVLGWLGPESASGNSSSSSGSGSVGSTNRMSDSCVVAAATGSPLLPVAAAGSVAGLTQEADGTLSQQQTAPGQRRQRRPLAHQHQQQRQQQLAPEQPAQPTSDAQQQQRRRQGKEQQQQLLLDELNLFPQARAALQHALASGLPAAVACVSVACHLPPFSQQLQQLPPRPPQAVVQFALQFPKVVRKIAFVSNCHALAEAADCSTDAGAATAGSAFLRDSLQQAGIQVLSQCLGKDPARLRMVQFLVQTQQPLPWAFTVEQLLVHTVLGPQGGGGSRAVFVEAYPEFSVYDEYMNSI